MLRKLLIGLAVLLILVGVGLAYLWHEATALPEWYDPAAVSVEGGAPAVADADWTPTADGQGQQLRNIHLRAKKLSPTMRKAIKGSRATYQDGHVEAGMVANLGDVPRQDLSKGDASFLEKASEAFPSLRERDVYVGVEGDTVIQDGNVQLGPGARLKIGNISYSLADAAKRMGIDEARLRSDLNAELVHMGVKAPK
ncbi:MAG: hypothetical protein R3B09_15690 [Nannocystaceae bacterium]